MSELKENLRALDLPLAAFVPQRYAPGNLGTWSGHLAFANDLVCAIQPSLLVELGTHWGESYFGFCQSIEQNGLTCTCYAIDTWVGEAHSNPYGEEVFEDVQRYNNRHFRSFSYLLRTTFDDALRQFADESIDLLHIDGLHTFEAVDHDFRTWFPKVKPGGIILLHDIDVRHVDFGVWRLWDRIASEFGETFAFHHWWGLGVLRKPGGKSQASGFLELLFDSAPSIQERIRRHYVIYASHLEHMLRAPAAIGTTNGERDPGADVKMLQELNESMRIELEAEKSKTAEMRAAFAAQNLSNQAEIQSLRDDVASERGLRSAIENSRSWRLTRPLRELAQKWRSIRK